MSWRLTKDGPDAQWVAEVVEQISTESAQPVEALWKLAERLRALSREIFEYIEQH